VVGNSKPLVKREKTNERKQLEVETTATTLMVVNSS
jgi:hypothetical protein